MTAAPGPTIGVLCLDTTFTKIPGHIRNQSTFGFPVTYQVVTEATPQRLVNRPDPRLLAPFTRGARQLQARGVAAITSACGFLVLFQAELAAAVTVPVYTSSLIQLPMVARMLGPGRKVGLLVANSGSLSRRHLAAIGGESVPVCVAGMQERREFSEVILGGAARDLDVARLRDEVLAEVAALARGNPEMGALIIECTDLVPFAADIQARAGVPVFDIVTLTRMVHQSLARQPFGAGLEHAFE
jgi:hypothetical protein